MNASGCIRVYIKGSQRLIVISIYGCVVFCVFDNFFSWLHGEILDKALIFLCFVSKLRCYFANYFRFYFLVLHIYLFFMMFFSSVYDLRIMYVNVIALGITKQIWWWLFSMVWSRTSYVKSCWCNDTCMEKKFNL